MKFVKSVSITLVTQILIVTIGIISSVIVARYLGPSGKGILAVLTVITGIALQFGNFGFCASDVYFTARDRDLLKNIASNSLWFGIVVGVLISIGIFLIVKSHPSVLGDVPLIFLVIILISVPFSLVTMFFQNILLGLQKIVPYNLINIVGQCGLLIFTVIILILLTKGIFELLIVRTAVAGLLSIVFVVYIYKLQKFFFNFDLKSFKKMFRYGFIFYINNILAFLVIRSDILLVNYYIGSAATGIYSIAVGFGDLLYMLPGIVGLILFPKLSAERGAQSADYTSKVSRFMVIIMLVACLFIALFFYPLVRIMYGVAFLPSVMPMMFLLPGIFFLSIETILTMYLAATNNIRRLPLYWGLATITNLVLNVILIPWIGVNGAAISSTVSYILITILVLKYFQSLSEMTTRETFIIRQDELKALFVKREK